MAVRQYSFPLSAVLPWGKESNAFSPALTLTDVDNDGEIEVAIGSVGGVLSIYKHCRPWCYSSGLGTISALTSGDIENIGKATLVVVTAEGYCHLFRLPPGDATHNTTEAAGEVRPLHSLNVPLNVSAILIADYDNSGSFSLIMGTHDRYVYAFEVVRLAGDDGVELRRKQSWRLSCQVSSLTLEKCGGKTALVVGMESGIAHIQDNCAPVYSGRKAKAATPVNVTAASAATHVASAANLTVIATLDGSIVLKNTGQTLWKMQFQSQLFAVYLVDFSGNGELEVVACGWDGVTFIIDTHQNVCKFRHPTSVCAFCTGALSLSPNRVEPCLVYATYDDTLVVYNAASFAAVVDVAAVHFLQPTLAEHRYLKNNPNAEWTEQEACLLLADLLSPAVLTDSYLASLEEQLQQMPNL